MHKENKSNQKKNTIQKLPWRFYREYKVYKIIDGAGNVFYNAHSDYLTEGFITVVADEIGELHQKIDEVYKRVNLLKSLPYNQRNR